MAVTTVEVDFNSTAGDRSILASARYADGPVVAGEVVRITDPDAPELDGLATVTSIDEARGQMVLKPHSRTTESGTSSLGSADRRRRRHQASREGSLMITAIDQVMGFTAYDSDGAKVGKVSQVYLDDETNEPVWVTVNTGLFGTSESFVPVDNATFSGDRLTIAYDKDKVKDAPQVAADGHLSQQEEQALYEYYGLSYGGDD